MKESGDGNERGTGGPDARTGGRAPPVQDGERSPYDDTERFEAALEALETRRFVLRLYVAGNAPRSRVAIENVRKLCDEYLADRCELEVIDIYQDPASVPEDLVLAAPTLIRRLPLPLRRVIGDMSAKEKVLVGLDLIPRA